MKTMKIRITMIAVLLLGFGAAQAEVCEDVIGVFFDTEAYTYETMTLYPFDQVTAYLLVLNPSDPVGISGWEARTEVVGSIVAPAWTLAAGLDVTPDENDWCVGIGLGVNALPTAPTVLLATFTGFVINPTDVLEFYVKPLPGTISFDDTPGYASGNDETVLIPLNYFVADPNLYACALVNGSGYVMPVCETRFDQQYMINITAHRTQLNDVTNYAGTKATAVDGYDEHDLPAAPAQPSNYLRLTFPHPEWGSPFGDDFDTDIRAEFDPVEERKVWTFRVETDDPLDPVTLYVSDEFVGTFAWDYLLVNHQTGEVVDLFDWSGSYVYTPNPDGVNYFDLVVGESGIPDLDPQHRYVGDGWTMVGAPLVPEFNTFESVILDDASATTFIMELAPGSGYMPMEGSDPFEQGMGYWVGAAAPFTWAMEGEKDLDPVIVDLNYGWTMVGYPMWFRSELNGIRVVDGANEYAWGDAVAAGLVGAEVYGYDNLTEAYVGDNVLEAWHGYWFQSYAPGLQLVFDYANMPLVALVGWEPYADLDDEQNWLLSVSVDGAPGVELGTCVLSSDGFDAYQDRAPAPRSPTDSGGAELYFDRPEWGLATGAKVSSDVRNPASKADHHWDAVLAVPSGGQATLTWTRAEWGGTSDLQVYLPEQNRVVVPSMRATTSVTLTVPETGTLAVQFRTPSLTGVEDVLPEVVATLTARPNPFNPQTELSFSSPVAGDAAVRVYDVLGRLVKTLDAGAVSAGGNGRVTWYGRDAAGREVSSGTYFASLSVGGKAVGEIRKLSLVR
jgi:hypothetical protein